ncbi:MAG: SMI1/KNR4 family protein [Pedobacter sp.]|jgi:hypothetical protein|nr:MAG: SMI1/KNR4 family protein [Pedobacter sp.]
MEKIVEKIKATWYKNSGAELQNISTVERDLDIIFPNDYKTFITWSNGGEGEVGGNYISLWKIEDIITLNNDYQIQKYLSKDFLAIGTDGGGVCYGFNLRDNFSFFKCPLGDLDINELSLITKSFKEFFEKAMIEEI